VEGVYDRGIDVLWGMCERGWGNVGGRGSRIHFCELGSGDGDLRWKILCQSQVLQSCMQSNVLRLGVVMHHLSVVFVMLRLWVLFLRRGEEVGGLGALGMRGRWLWWVGQVVYLVVVVVAVAVVGVDVVRGEGSVVSLVVWEIRLLRRRVFEREIDVVLLTGRVVFRGMDVLVVVVVFEEGMIFEGRRLS
jgi:hypothetical protein